MFILLGPLTADVDYHEIGRSMSTLMSNPVSVNVIANNRIDSVLSILAIERTLRDKVIVNDRNLITLTIEGKK